MNPTDISIVGPGTGGPTLSDEYIINLTHLLLFIIISSLIVWFINKKTKKENTSNENIENKNNKNSQMFSLIFALIVSVFYTKSYAVIAPSVYVYNIVSITLNFVIIFIANYVLQLIINKNKKKDFRKIFAISVIENIVFNVAFVIGLILSFKFIAIVISIFVIIVYKIFKLNHHKTYIQNKKMAVILYSIVLSVFILGTGANMRNYYSGHGIVMGIFRNVYGNNELIEIDSDITMKIQ